MTRPDQRGSPVTQSGIVGRRRELDALQTWLDLARAGTGRLVLCIGEPGIGKTRLAQELAGTALARGTAVAWGRCVEVEGAPAFWPWRQVLRSLGVEPDQALSGVVESPEDRFRVVDDVTRTVISTAGGNGLVVILDDVHWADAPSLLVLRQLADQVAGTRLLVFVALRPAAGAGVFPPVLPDLLRSPGAERLDLRALNLEEVREQLTGLAAGREATDFASVLDLTGGNPLFVREVARAMADGTWRPDRPPRSVLDIVAARLDGVSEGCRRFVQAAAVVGRDFSAIVVASALGRSVDECLPTVDEAIGLGLIDRVGDAGDYRFVHALTRDAVEASLTTADRVTFHRAVAEATTAHFAANLSEHVADIARHWAAVAPYGEAERAREWTLRAADDAVLRLAYEEGVRLYRAALEFEPSPLTDAERCRVLVALGRAAGFAGDLQGCVDAAVEAADAGRAAGSPGLVGEAALVCQASADAGTNAVVKQLCDRALSSLGDVGQEAMRARLLALRSHLAFYDGEQDRVGPLSALALELARQAGDDAALVDALHARKEACPGPAGRGERESLAEEMLSLGSRTSSARPTMWGELWRIDALIEGGEIAAAAEELPALQAAVDRIGGPVSAWHLERVSACVAQSQGRFPDALVLGRRAFERMRLVEPAPATGAYFALQCALAGHLGTNDEMTMFARRQFDPPLRFRTMARISRAFMLLLAGAPDEATASYRQAGPPETWSLPAFFVLPAHVYGVLVTVGLGRHDDLSVLLDGLRPFSGEHAVGESVSYLGPVDLTLGRGAAALGRTDAAIGHLSAAAEQADRAGAPGFAAEARHHLAIALLARDAAGDRQRARAEAIDADHVARALGMTAYVDRLRVVVSQLRTKSPASLSRREVEVAMLVAEGLTNREIAQRLVISERTAENHVQHILTKLGFATRSQIAAWVVRGGE